MLIVRKHIPRVQWDNTKKEFSVFAELEYYILEGYELGSLRLQNQFTPTVDQKVTLDVLLDQTNPITAYHSTIFYRIPLENTPYELGANNNLVSKSTKRNAMESLVKEKDF